MKLPTPANGVIWTFRRGEAITWHGMIWRGNGDTAMVRIEPFAESVEDIPDRAAQQQVLAKFWRKLGAA